MFRFLVKPAGRRFGWKGEVYASDPKTGELWIDDAAHAAALRELGKTTMIEEVSAEGAPEPPTPRLVLPETPEPPTPGSDGIWRFRIQPPSQSAVTWRGRRQFHDRTTGLLEVTDRTLAKSLSVRIDRGDVNVAWWGPPIPTEMPPPKILDPSGLVPAASMERPVQLDES